jgi:Protein of unknown function (DUF3562)
VPDAAFSTRKTPQSDEAAISALAKQTRTAVEVVRDLYEDEIATLMVQASVKNFIGVIAGRRVKQRLRERKRAPNY